MINLFRSIRQKLLKEGKIANYIKYAIGEILLVVIGIFIAIQANNWNIDRIAQKELRFELGKLVVNLEQDGSSLDDWIKQNNSIIADLDSCLVILKDHQSYSKAYFLQLFWPIHRTAEFNSNKVSFDNLFSSGKLQNIKNNLLIDSLSHYYSSDSYKSVEDAIVNHTREVIRPYLMGFDFLPITQDLMNGHNNEKLFNTMPKSLKDYSEDIRIINGIRFKIFLHSRLNEQYQLKMEESKRLINQIKEEIK